MVASWNAWNVKKSKKINVQHEAASPAAQACSSRERGQSWPETTYYKYRHGLFTGWYAYKDMNES